MDSLLYHQPYGFPVASSSMAHPSAVSYRPVGVVSSHASAVQMSLPLRRASQAAHAHAHAQAATGAHNAHNATAADLPGRYHTSHHSGFPLPSTQQQTLHPGRVASSALGPPAHRPPHSLRLRYRPVSVTVPDMAQSYPHHASSDDELAELQKLSQGFEAESTGPYVSELLPSSAITREYANADPAYQVKTKALPQKYSHYRTCRGDGNCGWRAVAFCYFETLLRLNDKARFAQEEARLRSFDNLLKSLGGDEDIFGDFRDEMMELLRNTAASVPVVDNGPAARLLAAFNDSSTYLSIIAYLKLLTSAHLRTRAGEYQPWIQGQTVDDYCQEQVNPTYAEIDNVAMSALAAVLVQPAGLALEILYLDRSPGEEVNTYYFGAEAPGLEPVERPTFRLLYRPGHYDILYKTSDVPAPIIPPQETTVYRQSHAPRHFSLSNPAGIAPEYEIPGLTGLSPGLGSPAFNSPFNFSYSNVDASPTSNIYLPSQHQQLPISPPEASFTIPLHPAAPPPSSQLSHDFMVPSNPMQFETIGMPLGHTGHVSHHLPPAAAPSDPFRFNDFHFRREGYNDPHAANILACQTNIFRNSPYNPAHFNNPDFEPEQWRPETDYTTEKKGRSSKSHG